jgi:hypothetical protein
MPEIKEDLEHGHAPAPAKAILGGLVVWLVLGGIALVSLFVYLQR